MQSVFAFGESLRLHVHISNYMYVYAQDTLGYRPMCLHLQAFYYLADTFSLYHYTNKPLILSVAA